MSRYVDATEVSPRDQWVNKTIGWTNSPVWTVCSTDCFVNSLVPGRGFSHFKRVIFEQASQRRYTFMSTCEIAIGWMPQSTFDDESVLVQVMAWCHRATGDYLSQCCIRSISPCGITRPQLIDTKYNVKAWPHTDHTCWGFIADDIIEMIFIWKKNLHFSAHPLSWTYYSGSLIEEQHCFISARIVPIWCFFSSDQQPHNPATVPLRTHHWGQPMRDNERRRYIVTSSLINWAHIQNDPCIDTYHVLLYGCVLEIL